MTASFHQDWLEPIVQRLQCSVGQILTSLPYDGLGMLAKLAASIPEPPGALETLVLRGLLMEQACKTSLIIHAAAHRHPRRPCGMNEMRLLKICANRSTSPVAAFSQWVERFSHDLRAAHPPDAFVGALTHLRTHFAQAHRESDLARRFGISSSQLRRSFSQTYGLSMRAYLERLRLLEALALVESEKVDGIATMVGYPSKSNFYRAFGQLFGRTPLQCRQLSPELRRRLAESRQPIVLNVRPPF